MAPLDFLIVALPRSGTTWASEWLSTDGIACHHDPLDTMHPSKWWGLHRYNQRLTGAADTGVWAWPDRVPALAERVLVLHRNPGRIIASLEKLDWPTHWVWEGAEYLYRIQGRGVVHTSYKALFDPREAPRIWAFLTANRVRFDPVRHRRMAERCITQKWPPRHADLAHIQQLINELPADHPLLKESNNA